MTLCLDRYLAEVDLRTIPAYRFDVVVVGGGIAGGAAALAAADEGRSVALVTKADLDTTNTRVARGGMAAVIADEDSFDAHIADTMSVGRGLCDADAVRRIVHGGPSAVQQLLDLGAQFDRRDDGSLHLAREGGHGQRRIIHADGDATGLELQRVMSGALSASSAITLFPDTFAIDVVTADGSVYGLLARNSAGSLVLYTAAQVILSTGGGGQLYRETTNPSIATADGVAIGLRAGATVRDMEFFQFHPTCLYIAGAARVLVSEVVRGHGGVLRDRHGDRFMPAAHDDAELAPRDVVSRAAFRRMIETGDTSVYLDLGEIDGDPHELFPAVSRICCFFGIDIACDPVPVRPGAHYMIGGLRVDADGRTGVPGLWAVGECASSGLHGANRIGSNSLLEGMVLGEAAGREAARSASKRSGPKPDRVLRSSMDHPPHGIELGVTDLTYSLKSLMWRQVGLERNGAALGEAIDRLAFWFDAARRLAPAEPRGWELINMLTVAQIATTAAMDRRESRGVHYRTDFPRSNDLAKHSVAVPAMQDGHRVGLQLGTASIEIATGAI